MSDNNQHRDDHPAGAADPAAEKAAEGIDAQTAADEAAADEPAPANDDAGERREGVYTDEEAALLIAQAEVADLKDKLLRAVAEGENVRRRAQRDVDEARKFAVSEFARDMLQVADNMHRAIAAVSDEARAEDAEVRSLLEGVELTERELIATLERHGIKRVDPLGEKLDPNLHQAVLQVDDAEAESGTVVTVMQIGYTLNDRLLRPAMVAVAK
jgi:molecular chaperone GrpE